LVESRTYCVNIGRFLADILQLEDEGIYAGGYCPRLAACDTWVSAERAFNRHLEMRGAAQLVGRDIRCGDCNNGSNHRRQLVSQFRAD
jgi:hypothetical protein